MIESNPINAKQLAQLFGDKLVGRWVITEPIGSWKGGKARVFAMSLDTAAPELVFNVSQETGTTIGVFEIEQVVLLEEKFALSEKQHISEDIALVYAGLPNIGFAREAFDRLADRLFASHGLQSL